MRTELVKAELAKHGLADLYLEFTTSSATVALAAEAVGCEPGRIAKTLAFNLKTGPVVIVAMGMAKIDNGKFKAQFAEKAKFLQPEEVVATTGHPVGGVCPFALLAGVTVYLDVSLRQFDPVYPAAGAANNAVKLTLAQLQSVIQGTWIDVCKV